MPAPARSRTVARRTARMVHGIMRCGVRGVAARHRAAVTRTWCMQACLQGQSDVARWLHARACSLHTKDEAGTPSAPTARPGAAARRDVVHWGGRTRRAAGVQVRQRCTLRRATGTPSLCGGCCARSRRSPMRRTRRPPRRCTLRARVSAVRRLPRPIGPGPPPRQCGYCKGRATAASVRRRQVRSRRLRSRWPMRARRCMRATAQETARCTGLRRYSHSMVPHTAVVSHTA